jgi:hypothetical protein
MKTTVLMLTVISSLQNIIWGGKSGQRQTEEHGNKKQQYQEIYSSEKRQAAKQILNWFPSS